ncbi:MAG TPA: dihydrodipicolinate synthase family protein [Dehalococcoidia bacterium]|nr:dihydrodipicolinate synthase family protein [Dehalococcoidia bacterium]
MLTKDDITGLMLMVLTPAKEGADRWEAQDTVDLEETERMTEEYIRAGVGGIAACGTTGECAGLMWDEKLKFIDTLVQTTRGRVPVFAGATSLGTRETIRQMKALKDVGADGAFIGLPLWQTPTLQNSIQWFADLSEAVPDMPIMVYANQNFFKSVFPTPFWAGVAQKAPTVVTCKISYNIANLLEDLRVAGHQIRFIPGENMIYTGYKLAGDKIKAGWSSNSAGMGPEPMVALCDAILANDEAKVDAIFEDIRATGPSFPPAEFNLFALYNVQANRYAANVSGYLKPCPTRPPYRLDDLPQNWREYSEKRAGLWKALRTKYAKTPA